MRNLLIAIAVVAFLWVVAIAALWVFGRKVAAKQLARAIPDLVALCRGLMGDPRVPFGSKVLVGAALAWVLSPIDLVPEFIPVLGPLDDVIVVGLVLRHLIKRAGPDVVQAHWRGDPRLLRTALRLAGLRLPESQPLNGSRPRPPARWGDPESSASWRSTSTICSVSPDDRSRDRSPIKRASGLARRRQFRVTPPSYARTMAEELRNDRQLAIDLFNETWALLETDGRTPEQDERMIHAAHGSRLHWEAAGTPENVAVGDWLCSRAYAVLGRAEPAMYHARWCLARAGSEALPDWVRAEAHEAMARAHTLLGELDDARRHAAEARAICDTIEDAEDRDVVLADLATLQLD